MPEKKDMAWEAAKEAADENSPWYQRVTFANRAEATAMAPVLMAMENYNNTGLVNLR